MCSSLFSRAVSPVVFFVILLAAFADRCCGQGGRAYHAATVESPAFGLLVSAIMTGAADDQSPSAVLRWRADGDLAVRQMSLPWEQAGGIAKLAEGRWLISGWSPDAAGGVGFLGVLEMAPGTAGMTLTSVEVLNGVDPYDVAWLPGVQRVVVYDRQSKVLLSAFMPSGAGVPLGSSFTLVDPGVAVDELLGPYVSIEPDGSRVLIRPSRVGEWASIALAGGLWTYAPASVPQPDIQWGVDPSSVRGHTGSVRAKLLGPGSVFPATFEIVDVQEGAVVGSGVQVSEFSWGVSASPMAFFEWPGREFEVRGGSSVAPARFRPLVRYGAPTGTPSIVAGQGACDAAQAVLGSAGMRVSCPLTMPGLNPVPGAPAPFNAYLAVGFGLRGAGVADPVLMDGDTAYLQPSLVLELPNRIQKWDVGGVTASLPIPNIPELEGLVVLMQWYVQLHSEPVGVAVSDVFGVRLRPALGGLQSQAHGAIESSAPLSTSSVSSIGGSSLAGGDCSGAAGALMASWHGVVGSVVLPQQSLGFSCAQIQLLLPPGPQGW